MDEDGVDFFGRVKGEEGDSEGDDDFLGTEDEASLEAGRGVEVVVQEEFVDFLESGFLAEVVKAFPDFGGFGAVEFDGVGVVEFGEHRHDESGEADEAGGSDEEG